MKKLVACNIFFSFERITGTLASALKDAHVGLQFRVKQRLVKDDLEAWRLRRLNLA